MAPPQAPGAIAVPPKPPNLVPPGMPAILEGDPKFETLWRQLNVLGLGLDKIWTAMLQNAEATPGAHGVTHTAGSDPLWATEEPSAITLGEHEGDVGSAGARLAREDHVHDDTALAGLADLVDFADTISESEANMRRLLELILVELIKMRKTSGVSR